MLVETHSSQLRRLGNLRHKRNQNKPTVQLTEVTFDAHMKQMASDVTGYDGFFPVTFSCIPFKKSDPNFREILRNSLTLVTSTSRDTSIMSMTSYLFNPEASILNIDVYMYGTMTSVGDFEEHIRDIFAHLLTKDEVIGQFEGQVGLLIYVPVSFERRAIEHLLRSKIVCKLGWELTHLYEKLVNDTHPQSTTQPESA